MWFCDFMFTVVLKVRNFELKEIKICLLHSDKL